MNGPEEENKKLSKRQILRMWSQIVQYEGINKYTSAEWQEIYETFIRDMKKKSKEPYIKLSEVEYYLSPEDLYQFQMKPKSQLQCKLDQPDISDSEDEVPLAMCSKRVKLTSKEPATLDIEASMSNNSQLNGDDKSDVQSVVKAAPRRSSRPLVKTKKADEEQKEPQPEPSQQRQQQQKLLRTKSINKKQRNCIFLEELPKQTVKPKQRKKRNLKRISRAPNRQKKAINGKKERAHMPTVALDMTTEAAETNAAATTAIDIQATRAIDLSLTPDEKNNENNFNIYMNDRTEDYINCFFEADESAAATTKSDQKPEDILIDGEGLNFSFSPILCESAAVDTEGVVAIDNGLIGKSLNETNSSDIANTSKFFDNLSNEMCKTPLEMDAMMQNVLNYEIDDDAISVETLWNGDDDYVAEDKEEDTKIQNLEKQEELPPKIEAAKKVEKEGKDKEEKRQESLTKTVVQTISDSRSYRKPSTKPPRISRVKPQHISPVKPPQFSSAKPPHRLPIKSPHFSSPKPPHRLPVKPPHISPVKPPHFSSAKPPHRFLAEAEQLSSTKPPHRLAAEAADLSSPKPPHRLPVKPPHISPVKPPHFSSAKPPHRLAAEAAHLSSAKPPHRFLAEAADLSSAKPPHRFLAEAEQLSSAKPLHRFLAEAEQLSSAKPPHRFLAEPAHLSSAKPPHRLAAEAAHLSSAKPPHRFLAEAADLSSAKPPHRFLAEAEQLSSAKPLHRFLAEAEQLSSAKPPHRFLAEAEQLSSTKPPHRLAAEAADLSSAKPPHRLPAVAAHLSSAKPPHRLAAEAADLSSAKPPHRMPAEAAHLLLVKPTYSLLAEAPQVSFVKSTPKASKHAIFGVKCFRFLDDNCHKLDCNHNLNTIGEVMRQLYNMKEKKNDIRSSYKLMMHSRKLFKCYLLAFAEIFGKLGMMSELARTVEDCALYKDSVAPMVMDLYNLLVHYQMPPEKAASTFMENLWNTRDAIKYEALTTQLLRILATADWYNYIEILEQLFYQNRFPMPVEFLKSIAMDAVEKQQQHLIDTAIQLVIFYPIDRNPETLRSIFEILNNWQKASQSGINQQPHQPQPQPHQPQPQPQLRNHQTLQQQLQQQRRNAMQFQGRNVNQSQDEYVMTKHGTNASMPEV